MVPDALNAALCRTGIRGLAALLVSLATALAQGLPDPKLSATKEVEQLRALYLTAATAEMCDLDLTDDEDETLQETVDSAEDAAEAAGLAPDQRDSLWNSIVAEIAKAKEKTCAEKSADALALIRGLKP